MQLDSEIPSCEQGGEVMFGSGGILYVFWCKRTRVSKILERYGENLLNVLPLQKR